MDFAVDLQKLLTIAENYAKETGGLMRSEHIIVAALLQNRSFGAYLMREAGADADKLLKTFKVDVCAAHAIRSMEITDALATAVARAAATGARELSVDEFLCEILQSNHKNTTKILRIIGIDATATASICQSLEDYLQKVVQAQNSIRVEIKRHKPKV